MIKHHPNNQLLAEYCAAQLPLALSVAVSAHIEMCSLCQTALHKIESAQAEQTWQQADVEVCDFGDLLQDILATPCTDKKSKPKADLIVKLAKHHYQLPRAFRSFQSIRWSSMGAIKKARLISDEESVRASLLHIIKGAEIPTHTHKGYEVTLLLAGSFSDESGSYNKGDFILLDNENTHSPKANENCVCYTVQDAPLYFTHGVSKILNPFGQILY